MMDISTERESPPMQIPIYVNELDQVCTKCKYYADLVNPSYFATRMYLGHLIRRSHTTEVKELIIACEPTNDLA